MAAPAAALRSIQVGRPRLVMDALGGPPFRSGICKLPVLSPLHLGPGGLPGDGQASRKYHGGPDKALLCYPAEHYEAWRRELARPDLSFGAFGENFTTLGLSEEIVSLGDRYAVGTVVIEVREPREPCSKLARHLGIADMVARVRRSAQSGWYCRVIGEGLVEPGMPLVLLARPQPTWTIARVGRILGERDGAGAAELLRLEGLAEGLKSALRKRIRETQRGP